MKVIWHGHGSFRIEIDGQVLLIDPWFTGNPVFPEDRRAEAVDGVTHILLTHAHSDHVADCRDIARETGATLVGSRTRGFPNPQPQNEKSPAGSAGLSFFQCEPDQVIMVRSVSRLAFASP